jgi:Na+/H+-dicarboxylate symporter
LETDEQRNPASTPSPRAPDAGRWWPWRWPLPLRVLACVVLGTALGHWFGDGKIVFGLTNADLGELGLLIVRLLTALAAPLILFAVLDAFLRTDISGRMGAKMIVICLVNVTVAFAIGLTIMNVWQPGLEWRGRVDELLREVGGSSAENDPATGESLAEAGATNGSGEKRELRATPSPLKTISGYIPESVVAPFQQNQVISIVLLGLLGGAALRAVRDHRRAAGQPGFESIETFIEIGYQVSMQMLSWLVQIVPLAVLGGVAMVVGKSGLKVFQLVGVYFVTMMAGLALHSLVYYPLSAWLIGGRSPRIYLGRGLDAVVTGFSANSSLATVPVTLRCLTEGMGVSQASARLSACVGTNFNNDGITLYEAMTALFAAQAFGYDLGLTQQGGVLLACLLASIGIAGLPGSGLIILQLVLVATGLPEHEVLAAFSLVLTVDWVLARVRSAVNVLGDMQVAILLDAGRPAASD